MEEKWLAVSFTSPGSPSHLFMNLSHVGLWCLRNTTKYLDTQRYDRRSTYHCQSSHQPVLPLWLRGNKLRKVTRLARVLPTPRVRAGLDQQDHEQESCLLYCPRQQPSHTHHHQEACQILFLTPAKGSPSLPFHGIVHHCQNNSDKIQCLCHQFSPSLLKAYLLIFPNAPFTQSHRDQISFDLAPQAAPSGHFPDWRIGARVGRRPRSLYTEWGGGGKSHVCWASGIAGPAPSMVSGDLLLYGNTSATLCFSTGLCPNQSYHQTVLVINTTQYSVIATWLPAWFHLPALSETLLIHPRSWQCSPTQLNTCLHTVFMWSIRSPPQETENHSPHLLLSQSQSSSSSHLPHPGFLSRGISSQNKSHCHCPSRHPQWVESTSNSVTDGYTTLHDSRRHHRPTASSLPSYSSD